MKMTPMKIEVNGLTYLVVDRGGHWKATINGYLGWTSVWADTYQHLIRRIEQIRSGGQ